MVRGGRAHAPDDAGVVLEELHAPRDLLEQPVEARDDVRFTAHEVRPAELGPCPADLEILGVERMRLWFFYSELKVLRTDFKIIFSKFSKIIF